MLETFIEMLNYKSEYIRLMKQMEEKAGVMMADYEDVQLTPSCQELFDEFCAYINQIVIIDKYMYDGKRIKTQSVNYENLRVYVYEIEVAA